MQRVCWVSRVAARPEGGGGGRAGSGGGKKIRMLFSVCFFLQVKRTRTLSLRKKSLTETPCFTFFVEVKNRDTNSLYGEALRRGRKRRGTRKKEILV